MAVATTTPHHSLPHPPLAGPGDPRLPWVGPLPRAVEGQHQNDIMTETQPPDPQLKVSEGARSGVAAIWGETEAHRAAVSPGSDIRGFKLWRNSSLALFSYLGFFKRHKIM